MHITDRSIIKFEVNFTLPINTIFNKVIISDSLPAGLWAYDGEGFGTYDYSTVYLDDSDTPPTSGVTHNSTYRVINLELDSSIATSPNSIRKVKILIPALVYDADEFLAAIDAGIPDPNNLGQTLPLENIATITALDNNDQVLTTVSATSPLTNFKPCNLITFGGAYTVDKTSDETAYLLSSLTGIDSFGTGDLKYLMIIDVHPDLDISQVYYSNATLTVDGYTYILNESNIEDEDHPLYGLDFNVDNNLLVDRSSENQKIFASFLHRDIMKGSEIYLSIPVTTKSTIVDLPNNFVLNDSILELRDIHSDDDLLCTSQTFDIRVNLKPINPKISDAIKIII